LNDDDDTVLEKKTRVAPSDEKDTGDLAHPRLPALTPVVAWAD